ncbi:MAG: molybdopterin-dependent oxidoreductase, partial [Chloroflexi bacterium]|nr:molybdopterin-dependent oxidoreductase [Chloroflexota bacterium]
GFLLGSAGALLAACLPGQSATPTTNAPGGGVAATALPEATQPGWKWEIRWLHGRPRIDEGAYQLRIDGMVEQPQTLTLGQVKALPSVTERVRMKCVECWSAPAVYTGVTLEEVFKLVQPAAQATHVRFYAADNYDDTLSLDELRAARVMLAYGQDGADLPIDNGWPLRLVTPSKYGYKYVKGVVRLEFIDRMVVGSWERYGYSTDATVQAGFDRPLDLGGVRPIPGGEQAY